MEFGGFSKSTHVRFLNTEAVAVDGPDLVVFDMSVEIENIHCVFRFQVNKSESF